MANVEQPATGGASVSPDGSLTAERTPGGLAFRASRTRVVRLSRGLFAFGLALPLALVVVAGVSVPVWAGAVPFPIWIVFLGLCLCGVIGGIAAWYHWSTGAVPLVAEASGRVVYGNRVLLEVGAGRRLLIERVRDSEDGDWFRVLASNRWGPVVTFPAPYFEQFASLEAATWFAQRLGGAIGAEVDHGRT